MASIIIADDHPVTLNGISQYLRSLGYRVIKEHTNGIEACNSILTLLPDYAIVDFAMPGMNGLEVLEKIRGRNRTIKVIVYTMYTDAALFEKAKALGVNGYVLKDFALEELKDCLQTLKFQKQWLSPKLDGALEAKPGSTEEEKVQTLSGAERKILSLIAARKTSRQIADQLFISEKTVENHRSNIVKKLGLSGGSNTLSHWAVQNAERL